MHKLDLILRPAAILLGVLLILIVGVWAIIDSHPPPVQVVTLMLDSDGKPVIEYAGPGVYDLKSRFGACSFKVESIPGSPQIQMVTEFKRGAGKAYAIYIRSSAVDPFQLQLVGFSTNENSRVSLEKTTESIPMPSGGQTINLNRFLVYYAHPKS